MAAIKPAEGKWSALGAFIARAVALSTPYFSSDAKGKARGMLAGIVALNLALVYMAVVFNDWNRLFYDALQDKNAAVFWEQLGRFCYLAFGFIVLAVYKFYLTQLLEMRWRAWMTRHYLHKWMSNQAFYRMELARYGPAALVTPAASPAIPNEGQALAPNPDNPDQRIQEDINQFTSFTISLSMGLLNSVVTLVSFVGILWSLSGAFAFSLGGEEYSIPGFMVWMAVLYCAVGSVITHYIGRKQIPLNFTQQRLEADFRHHLIRAREYSESIALDRGEAVVQEQLTQRFSRVLANNLALIRAQKGLIWFTSFFGQAAVIFPFVVAAPRFFSGAIQLGQLTQIAGAFGQVQGALSWFVDTYSNLASWRATTDRLTGFEASFQGLAQAGYAHIAIKNVASDAEIVSGEARATASDAANLDAGPLRIGLPDGSTLLDALRLRAGPGDRILLQGPSGSGKSTLFRTLAGIWPYAQGPVDLPADSMFLPQRAYFPNGPLRDALAYPEAASYYSDSALQQALRDALLPDLAGALDTSGAWGQKLSGGEQQRLAIARVFLKKPLWLFADEATSALDEAAEATLYQRLCDGVSARGGALVSIAHRPALAAFHTRRWIMEPAASAGEAGSAAANTGAPAQVAALFTLVVKPA